MVDIEDQLGHTYLQSSDSVLPQPMPLLPAPPADADDTAGDVEVAAAAAPAEAGANLSRTDDSGPVPYLRVSGLNRALYAGSFAIHVIATVHNDAGHDADPDAKAESYVVASKGVLSRWRRAWLRQLPDACRHPRLLCAAVGAGRAAPWRRRAGGAAGQARPAAAEG